MGGEGKAGLSLRGRGRGFPPVTKNVAPSYFHRKIEGKKEPKEIPSCLIPRLLVVFTRQLEILVTALKGREKPDTSALIQAFHPHAT